PYMHILCFSCTFLSVLILSPYFFFHRSGTHRDLPSFPTRRSSDLGLRRLPNRVAEPRLREPARGGRDIPDARQHHTVGPAHDGGIGGQLGLGARCTERAQHAARVRRAVVRHRDHYSAPLVDGTSVTRGSVPVASPRARAAALKT